MNASRPLHLLARLCGIAPRYRDVSGQIVTSRDSALVSILHALECDLPDSEDEAANRRAIEATRARHAARGIAPCHVFWNGSGQLELGPAADISGESLDVLLETETGGEIAYRNAPVRHRTSRNGTLRTIPLSDVPFGLYRVRLGTGATSVATHIVSAPSRAFAWDDRDPAAHEWGLFAPAYALRDRTQRGTGDIGSLRRMLDWTTARGGRLVGTLPLLATFFEEPFSPSPYTPASRLFWNELFADLDDARERFGGAAAKALWRDSAWIARLAALEAEPLVDYRTAHAVRRAALAALSHDLFASPGGERDRYESWHASHPRALAYARFRARERGPAEVRHHLFCQWLLDDQLARLAHGHERAGLLLDLPLGVHPEGFERKGAYAPFADGVSVGAPPDTFFASGQNWGFAPLDPLRSREDGHEHLAACLAHQMRVADALRIDHVMGLFRLYWIPTGADARDGAYVRYRADEALAVITLMSHRHRCVVIGEDLGTVPDYVRQAMSRHAIARTYVAQTELRVSGDASAELPDPPPGSLATIGTHDMPSFAGYMDATDVDVALRLGTIDHSQAEERRRDRSRRRVALALLLDGSATAAPRAVLEALLLWLAAGSASCVMLNLEDLWLELEQQNVPGTGDEHPNWRRRAARSLESLATDPQITRLLDRIAAARGSAGRRVDEGDATA